MGGGGTFQARPRVRAARRSAALALSLILLPALLRAATAPVPGDLFVVYRRAGGGSVLLVKHLTGAVTTISAGGRFADPRRLAIGDDGMLYVADSSGNVIRVDPRTGSQTIVVQDSFRGFSGIALAPGSLAFLTIDVPPTPLALASLASGLASSANLDSPSLMTAVDLVREPVGTLILVDSSTTGDVIRADPVLGSTTSLNAGVTGPQAVTLEADGSIIVAAGTPTSAGIFRLRSDGKPASVVAQGGRLVAPRGVAVAPFGTIYVTDQASVIAIDPRTGTQTTLASGSSFTSPHGIAVVTASVKGCGNGILDPGEECDQGDGNGGTSSCCTSDCHLAATFVPCAGQSGFCGTQPDGVACTSDDPCTTGGKCVAGACTGGTVQCAANFSQKATRAIQVDCTVSGAPRQRCAAQGYLAPDTPAPADAVPTPLAATCAAGSEITPLVDKPTKATTRARFNVPLRGCAKRRLRKSGSLDVIMVMRMGSGTSQREILRRLHLVRASAGRS